MHFTATTSIKAAERITDQEPAYRDSDKDENDVYQGLANDSGLKWGIIAWDMKPKKQAEPGCQDKHTRRTRTEMVRERRSNVGEPKCGPALEVDRAIARSSLALEVMSRIARVREALSVGVHWARMRKIPVSGVTNAS